MPSKLDINYLRRRDARRRVMFSAILECREVSQNVRVVEFSTSGVRVDGIKGLASGDPVRISLTPELVLEGQIARTVWHKSGVQISQPLAEDDPAYRFLVEKADGMYRARDLALASLAQDRARR